MDLDSPLRRALRAKGRLALKAAKLQEKINTLTGEDLPQCRRLIQERDEALAEAHDALRSNASGRERRNARAAIEAILPCLSS